MTAFLLIGLGIVLLYTGGEVLVTSVVRLAAAFRIAPLIIGLTVVAFGTSSPEVAVAVDAALIGEPEIALGNVLGSNIANLGLILALAALVRPVVTHASFLRRDLPFLLAMSVALVPVAWVMGFGRILGLLLLLLLGGYLWVLLRDSRLPELDSEEEVGPPAPRAALMGTIGSVLGIGLLVFGADVLVEAAVDVARGYGISERTIGLTLVAFGTSLPELAGCLVAALHGEGDLVAGNVTGSNIFNTLLVLPAAILIRPMAAGLADVVDLAVVAAFTLAAWFFFRRERLGSGAGVLLLGGYVTYVVYLFASA